MDEKWINFKLESKTDSRIYLKGEWDITSYDEDTNEGDWSYEQNNGMMEAHIPRYWKVDGENLSEEYDQFIDSIDWDMFRQNLFDCQDESKSFDCGDYILHVNDGAKIEKINDKYCFNGEAIDFDNDIKIWISEEIEECGEANEFDIVASHYARQLTRNLGVYAKYGDLMEQALDDSYDNAWLFKLSNVTDDTLDTFLINEGLNENDNWR